MHAQAGQTCQVMGIVNRSKTFQGRQTMWYWSREGWDERGAMGWKILGILFFFRSPTSSSISVSTLATKVVGYSSN